MQHPSDHDNASNRQAASLVRTARLYILSLVIISAVSVHDIVCVGAISVSSPFSAGPSFPSYRSARGRSQEDRTNDWLDSNIIIHIIDRLENLPQIGRLVGKDDIVLHPATELKSQKRNIAHDGDDVPWPCLDCEYRVLVCILKNQTPILVHE